MGSNDATVVVVEFGDFECPFCKRFTTEMETLKEEYGNRVALVYVHYPLRTHRFARPAARAAECAAEQSRFGEFHDELFERQDSLGLKSWLSYAIEAGVQDEAAFGRCVDRSDPVPLIERGLEVGKKLGVTGTPTIVINGWRYPPGMDAQTLHAAVSAALAGKDPVNSR
ncbi:MAG: DsbA family protein [Longimicrobiales bacterium]